MKCQKHLKREEPLEVLNQPGRRRHQDETVSLEEDLQKKTGGLKLIKIPGLNDFYITENGEVFSVKVHKLKIVMDCYGYKKVYTREGRMKHHTIHRLIAKTFLVPIEGQNDVRHLDGKKENNLPENLAWGTRAHNCEDRRRHRILYNRKWNSFQKLNEAQVSEIRELSKQGFSSKKIALIYGVKSNTISGIISGVKWKNFTQARAAKSARANAG